MTRVFLLIFLFLSFNVALEAAPRLERISFAKRADGKGYVVRLHASEKILSKDLTLDQSDKTTIKITLYNTRISSKLSYGVALGPIKDYTIRQRRKRVIVTLKITPDALLRVVAYPDRSSNDFLIALSNPPQPMPASIPPASQSPPVVKVNLEKPAPEPTVQPETTPEVDVHAARWKLDCVVVDAGHGGHDSGARANRLREKNINLGVALKLGKLLEQELGLRVIYTRKTDIFIGLKKRGHIANEQCGKLFISIHTNSARNRSAHGTETYFLGLHKTKAASDVMKRENSVVDFEEETSYEIPSEEQLIVRSLTQSAYLREGEQLAGYMQSQFTQRAKRNSRGVKQAGFIVLWQASMPAVLVELGFVTNRAEAKFLGSAAGQNKMARSIFEAVRTYKQAYEKSINDTASE